MAIMKHHLEILACFSIITLFAFLDISFCSSVHVESDSSSVKHVSPSLDTSSSSSSFTAIQTQKHKIPLSNSNRASVSFSPDSAYDSFLYDLNADILLISMDFLLPFPLELVSLLRRLHFSMAVKFFKALSLLFAKDHLPLSIDRCIGKFTFNELLVLSRLAPEIIEAFKQNRLASFLDPIAWTLPVYRTNARMLIDSNNPTAKISAKFFFNTLKNIEIFLLRRLGLLSSWSDICKFAENYCPSLWITNYSTISDQHPFLKVFIKYLSHDSVAKLAGEIFFSKTSSNLTKLFALGMMLSCNVPQYSFNGVFEKVSLGENDDFIFFLEGFLTANNDPSVYTDEDMRITKVRNEIFVNRLGPILQNEEFSLVNTLKFGTLADVEALQRSRVLAIFDRLFVEDKIYYLALIRRPVLKDFWCKMSEGTGYFDKINGLLNVDYISKNAQCFDDKFDKMFLTNYCKPDENCLKSFTTAVKNYVYNTDKATLLDNAFKEGRRTETGYFSLIYCFVDAMKKHEFHLIQPLFFIIDRLFDWTEIFFPDHPLFYRDYLKKISPIGNPTSTTIFITSLINDDKVAIQNLLNYLIFTPDLKTKFFEEILEKRLLPVAYMRQFLMAWANCSRYELEDLFRSQFLFETYPNNFQKTTLSTIIHSLWVKTNTDMKKKSLSYSKKSVNDIPYPELWYFYMLINERGFEESCPLFEEYFRFDRPQFLQ